MRASCSGIKLNGSFLSPFDDEVWKALLATMFLIVTTMLIIKKALKKQNCDKSIVSFCVDSIAALSQQGVDVPKTSPLRIVYLFLFGLVFLFFNYYTSTIVSNLLSVMPRAPESMRELIDSPLVLVFEDIAYQKTMFEVPTF